MFGLSMWEIVVILIVALIFIGPNKLPEIARSLGKGLREFRGAADHFRENIENPDGPPKPDGRRDTQPERMNIPAPAQVTAKPAGETLPVGEPAVPEPAVVQTQTSSTPQTDETKTSGGPEGTVN